MSLAYRISTYNRKRKWRIFNSELRPGAAATVLDVGYSDREYGPSDNFLEKHYPYPEKITALGTEDNETFSRRYPQVRSVRYDGRHFPFVDRSFAVCWSNAVLEHVGTREQQVFFLREMKRVGGRSFLTTPNKFFPVEVHTRIPLLHWLPKKYFDSVCAWLGKSWASGGYMRLLSLRELRELLAEAGITRYRIIKNRLGPFVLDFVVIF